MALEEHELETAETLYRSWDGEKRLNCLETAARQDIEVTGWFGEGDIG